MSTTDTTVRLPETVEEFQRALREAFHKGAWWGLSPSAVPRADTIIAEARELYPIRKKAQRTLVSPDGSEWRCVGHSEGPRFYVLVPGSNRSIPATGWTPTPDLVKLWSDLLARPYEEVEE